MKFRTVEPRRFEFKSIGSKWLVFPGRQPVDVAKEHVERCRRYVESGVLEEVPAEGSSSRPAKKTHRVENTQDQSSLVTA